MMSKLVRLKDENKKGEKKTHTKWKRVRKDTNDLNNFNPY